MIPFWRKEHREEPDKKTFIVQHGGILLEKLINTFDGKRNPIRNFSSEELKLATKNYDMVNVMVDYGLYKLYKGFLPDRQISVMKFESKSQQACDVCINNIVFASQMCHKHILMLIGCCLETPIPILVFESLVKYGTLQDHIDRHHEPHLESLSWRQRLKITMEIANTFAYLHVGFPRPIVYAYISALQFLLDEHYVPKLVDFSYAECIPEGQTQIKDAQVRGFIGFMAPEQFNGVLNESCDVYGFGALLFEVLTGQWIHNLVCSNEMKDEDFKSSSETKDNEDRELSYKTKEKYWLCNFVKKINEDNRFIEVVDPIIAEDVLCPEIEHQVKVFAQLAVKCQSFSAEDRPTMIDVAKQLRQLYLSTS